MKLANNSSKNKNRRTSSSKCPPPDDGIATRTRRETKAIAYEWDLETHIIIEVFSWLDQDSLMNLSLVSKQLNNIIANEPGNKNNRIIPVFEVTRTSPGTLYRILRHHFKDEKKKLQNYRIMRFKDSDEFDDDDGGSTANSYYELKQIVKNVHMNGITLLDFSSLPPNTSRNRDTRFVLLYTLPVILPKLREVNFSNTCVDGRILSEFSKCCPLLEKVASNNAQRFKLNGEDMQHSNALKEIYMDNTMFILYFDDRDKFADLNNHQEIFIFHKCCKAIERVSIRNTKYQTYNHQIKKISQNAFIKFVRNAPPTLRWFRSDLTLDNMTMLRLERPGIELLN
jgi:hypothetical protein